MARTTTPTLSRRERQIMDIIYARNSATVAEVRQALPDPPSYSAVRALVRILEDKGHLKHRRQGVRYIYLPTKARRHAGKSALKRALHTFYDGDVNQAVAALLDVSDAELSRQQIERIRHLIEQTRKEGR